MDKKSIHEQVTENIIAMLERGTLPWRRPWETSGTGLAVPANGISKRPYHGINRVILWTSALLPGEGSTASPTVSRNPPVPPSPASAKHWVGEGAGG